MSEVENTVTAFLEARTLGVDGVELDVRRTRDGALVVYHDDAIADLGGIAELDCRDLPGTVATLDEAMIACSGLRVNVEIKNDAGSATYDATGGLARQVVVALLEGGWRDSVLVSSFDLATCQATRSADDTIAIGWLLDWRHPTSEALATTVAEGFNAVHPFFGRIDEATIAAAHGCGLAVNVWTVNGREDMTRLVAWGVDGLITDDPATAMAVVAARPGSPDGRAIVIP